jgi:DNA-binding CsgD family transcriptional regulator
LTGLVLHSRIQTHALFADSRIVQFTKKVRPLPDLKAELTQAKKEYAEKVLLKLFDLTKAITSIKELQAYLVLHRTSFNPEVFTWADELLTKMQALQITAEKFGVQIKLLFAKMMVPEEDNELQDRLKKGAVWFTGEIKAITEAIQQSPAVTDSTMHAKEYNEVLREAFAQLSQRHYLMQSLGNGFTIDGYQRRKKLFTTPSFGVNAYAGAEEKKVDLQHPSLFYSLKKLRDSLCAKKNLPIYLVASGKTLEEMANYLPQTVQELEQISGFGKAKVESYGQQFLEIIQTYAEERNLASSIVEKTPKRKRKEKTGAEKKTDTKTETFRLFQEGKVVREIAEERKLTIQTIEGHLSHYVFKGAIKIESLVSREKIVLIEPALKDFEKGTSIMPVKEKLPDVSFGEIRLVMAYMDSQKSATHVDQ